MTREEILDLIKSLARSQGFYGRLYRSRTSASKEDQQAMKEYLETKNFKTGLDFILALEWGDL